MKIALVRHGEAEPFAARDAERALTARGQAQARETGAWLRVALAGQGRARLLASPYRRAQETARAVMGEWPLECVTVDAITPDTDPRVALAAIEQAAGPADEVLVVVSHMPLVAGLASWLESATVAGSRGFGLAEARVLETDLLGPGLARQVDVYVPGLTGRG